MFHEGEYEVHPSIQNLHANYRSRNHNPDKPSTWHGQILRRTAQGLVAIGTKQRTHLLDLGRHSPTLKIGVMCTQSLPSKLPILNKHILQGDLETSNAKLTPIPSVRHVACQYQKMQFLSAADELCAPAHSQLNISQKRTLTQNNAQLLQGTSASSGSKEPYCLLRSGTCAHNRLITQRCVYEGG